ncbi:MAG: phosphate transport regulator [Armatimonadetes bacterium RBG_16_58_9]|nr:MAG: phosphate transport regulator [Armatimonadetes bacterium RBG_16_58_9]
MGLRLIPREEKFFDLFNEQAATVLEGARLLRDFFEDYTDVEQKRMKIEKTESHGDEICHRIVEKLNTTFITPMDREDIHSLSSALDDILDFVNASAQRMGLYHVRTVKPDAKALTNIILRAAEETLALTESLSNMKNVKSMKERWIEVNRLENEGDKVSRAAIAGLFENEKDPIEVIKWKEIYEHLEMAIDKCEDAANIVESVVLKNA